MVPPIDFSRFEQLKASGDLPSPRGVALAIMRLTQQDDVSIHELADIVRGDPAFVGRLIKAANGIVGYGHRPVVSVQEALTVLGLPAVRNMALGFSLLAHYRGGICEAFDYGHFWASSLLSAIAMQALALRTRVVAADECYCLGLLARVGELALATLYPHDYSRIVSEARGKGIARLLELEANTFTMTSAELGSAMLADWGMPCLFTDAAYSVANASPLEGGGNSRSLMLAQSLSLSRLISEAFLADEAQKLQARQAVLLSASRLSFDEEAVAVLEDELGKEWLAWLPLLDLPR